MIYAICAAIITFLCLLLAKQIRPSCPQHKYFKRRAAEIKAEEPYDPTKDSFICIHLVDGSSCSGYIAEER